MSNSEWAGQLWLGRDYGLIQGMLGQTTEHAHYAHQLLLAPREAVTISLEGRPLSGQRLFIEAQRRHAILAAPGEVFSLYAEPLAISAAALQSAVATVEWSLPALDQALRQCPRQPLGDSRLERALAELDELISGKVAARQLAQAAHLSLSQLERLFGEHLGLPIRRLVLWRRLRLALAQVLAGSSLTVAAHNAGFADSAHFSRTMKKLFGVSAGRSLPPLECRLLD